MSDDGAVPDGDLAVVYSVRRGYVSGDSTVLDLVTCFVCVDSCGSELVCSGDSLGLMCTSVIANGYCGYLGLVGCDRSPSSGLVECVDPSCDCEYHSVMSVWLYAAPVDDVPASV